ncbi:MAG TPA: cytochrome d ubiquinol oxidase subunit II [Jatrophihabitans sp.]|nr:cytochrome d ubiquinol oxidase subunit II [Jatrophihabitans sp.]
MQAFWFGVIAVLWAGFFVLEGFDFGVGLLLPVVARNESGRSVLLRSIGPVWDGNEVWLLVAGGATFAAFPEWYASMFAGFYLAFALLLVGLILRGIGIEYRGKAETATGRRWCEAAVIVGSFLPALLLGVAFANFLRGLSLDAQHTVTNGFFSLLNPFALLGGLVTLGLFLLHGAYFLTLRTDGPIRDSARRTAQLVAPVVIGLGAVFLAWASHLRGTPLSMLLAAVIAGALLAGIWASRRGRDGWAFTATAAGVLLLPIWEFSALWPNVLPARNNAANSLTVHNASSSHHTLVVMTGVALVVTPIVLAYQAWTYWVFRARVTGRDVAGSGYGPADRVLQQARESMRDTLGLDGAAPAEQHDAGPVPRRADAEQPRG